MSTLITEYNSSIFILLLSKIARKQLTLAPILASRAIVHPRQRHRNLPEQNLYVMTNFCARFDKHEVVLPRFFFALLCRDFTFVREVRFVPD